MLKKNQCFEHRIMKYLENLGIHRAETDTTYAMPIHYGPQKGFQGAFGRTRGGAPGSLWNAWTVLLLNLREALHAAFTL